MKIVNMEGEKASYLLNSLRNFNEIFRKDVAFDNIKSHKIKTHFLNLGNTFLEKPREEGGSSD